MYANHKSTQTVVCGKVHAKKDKEYIKSSECQQVKKLKVRMQTPCNLLVSTMKCAGFFGIYTQIQRTSLVIRNSIIAENSGKQNSYSIQANEEKLTDFIRG